MGVVMKRIEDMEAEGHIVEVDLTVHKAMGMTSRIEFNWVEDLLRDLQIINSPIIMVRVIINPVHLIKALGATIILSMEARSKFNSMTNLTILHNSNSHIKKFNPQFIHKAFNQDMEDRSKPHLQLITHNFIEISHLCNSHCHNTSHLHLSLDIQVWIIRLKGLTQIKWATICQIKITPINKQNNNNSCSNLINQPQEVELEKLKIYSLQ